MAAVACAVGVGSAAAAMEERASVRSPTTTTRTDVIKRHNGRYEIYDPKTWERKAYGVRSRVNPQVIEFFDLKGRRLYNVTIESER